ncbi:MAG TPA: glycine betaine ABC transporter substrate-binding protein [Euzebyales bacterium]|nr:glycine betaine ABC transporter substrate-binding protein [Euzebyales bacterium]
MQRQTRKIRLLALLAALLVLVAACGGDGGGDGAAAGGGSEAAGGGEGGPVSDSVDLSGVSVTVGSKEFTEQRIVGQMAVAALEAAGAQVTDQTGLTGTETVRTALENGEVDMYWEYTGTGWITILQNDEALEDAEAYFQRVAEADAENGIVWLEPSEVNNTYAFFINPAVTDLDVSTLSELAEVAQTNPEQVTLCAATEFITRPDGLPGVTEAYGFEFSEVVEADLSLAIQAAIEGEQCTVGEIFQTDPQILAQDLTVLEDDQSFFPVYNLAMTIRDDTYNENQEAYDALFGEITSLLNNDTMTELNSQVELEGSDPADVARDFLASNGIIPE